MFFGKNEDRGPKQLNPAGVIEALLGRLAIKHSVV
mgnify:CR=1 FL=1